MTLSIRIGPLVFEILKRSRKEDTDAETEHQEANATGRSDG